MPTRVRGSGPRPQVRSRPGGVADALRALGDKPQEGDARRTAAAALMEALRAAEAKPDDDAKEKEISRKYLAEVKRMYEKLASQEDAVRKQAEAALEQAAEAQAHRARQAEAAARAQVEAQEALKMRAMEVEKAAALANQLKRQDMELKRFADDRTAIAKEAQDKIKPGGRAPEDSRWPRTWRNGWPNWTPRRKRRQTMSSRGPKNVAGHPVVRFEVHERERHVEDHPESASWVCGQDRGGRKDEQPARQRPGPRALADIKKVIGEPDSRVRRNDSSVLTTVRRERTGEARSPASPISYFSVDRYQPHPGTRLGPSSRPGLRACCSA